MSATRAYGMGKKGENHMNLKIMEFLSSKDEYVPKETIAENVGISPARVTMDLLRLQEEGKVESRIVDGKRVWGIKEDDEEQKKMEQRAH